MSLIVRLKVKLIYNDVIVQLVSHDATGKIDQFNYNLINLDK